MKTNVWEVQFDDVKESRLFKKKYELLAFDVGRDTNSAIGGGMSGQHKVLHSSVCSSIPHTLRGLVCAKLCSSFWGVIKKMEALSSPSLYLTKKDSLSTTKINYLQVVIILMNKT